MINSRSKKIIQQTECCYDGFFKLKRHTIQYQKFNGSKSRIHKREVLVREPTVAILIYDPQKEAVLLTEQFRIGPLENKINPWVFELPAGIIDQGEDKELAAKREVLEETGYSVDIKETIGEFYLSPGGTNEVTTLFYAESKLEQSGLHGVMGENEDIRTHIISLDTAIEMMKGGNLSATTGLGLMWLVSKNNKENS